MANVIGRRTYSNARSSRIIQNVLPTLLLVDSDIEAAAFLAFYNSLPVEKTSQEKFTWDVDSFLSLTDTTAEAFTGTTATTIGVTNPSRHNPGRLILNSRSNELMLTVSVDTATSNITVVRAVSALNSGGGTAAAAILSGDTLILLSPAVGENSSRQTTQTTTPTEVYNFCQAMRWDLSLSRRQLKRAYENGDDLPYQTQKSMSEAKKQMNALFIDGQRGRYTDSNGDDITLSQGIRGVPTTYTYAVGGTLHENSFDEFLMEKGLRKGSRRKVLLSSTAVILAITQIAKERITPGYMQLSPKKGGIGIQVLEYMAPNGATLAIVEDRHLSETHNGVAIGLDMSQLKRKVFSNNGIDDSFHLISDTQDKDDLGTVLTLYGDEGLQYGAEDTHFLVTGVTGGATGSSGL